MQPKQASNAYILHRAPETEINNHISIQTDIYQVGLTLFRLINGIGLIRDLMASLGRERFEAMKASNKIPRPMDYQPFVPAGVKRIISKSVKADPDDRYQSALEMRRALEAISLQGYWTTDANGRHVGYCNNQIFRYEHSKSNRGIAFQAFRKRLKSGKENRIAKIEGKRLSGNEYKRVVKEFMLAVVHGDI